MADHQHPTNGNGSGPHNHLDGAHEHEDADLVVELDDDEKDQITVSLAESLGGLMREYVRGETSYEELTIEVFATLQALISVREGELPLEWLDLLNINEDDDSEGEGEGESGSGGDGDNLRWLRGKPDA